MINTKIMERRTAKDFVGQVDDALVLDVIRSYKKQMEKARGEFVDAGERGKEQIAEIDFEIEWCSKFLPQGASEAELRDAVAEGGREAAGEGSEDGGQDHRRDQEAVRRPRGRRSSSRGSPTRLLK